ncbi:hypothetical protein D5F01_LYC07726 [Larimichthys crocea]|uniref:Transmembrane protein 81 n=1 Tax=Larimichthys crocea TaxID=215358 RepID=A0A6G0IMI7_LARCR|nr:hypothetical protein D5F01_LYC07726 [Larimichthys crocea]
MQRMTTWLHLLLLLFHPLTQVHPEEVDKVPVEVIVDSSPCSTTCGLGIKTQTMCFLKDGETAMEEDARSKDGAELSKECRVRKVKCQESWQCGLRTMTVTSGQRVEMDCVEEIMEAMGKFSWRVSWRYARGIISSDDTLFTRRDAPLLDRVVLDPVTEEDAGTYRCDVQDASFRRVKGILGNPRSARRVSQSRLRKLSGPVELNWKPDRAGPACQKEALDLRSADHL